MSAALMSAASTSTVSMSVPLTSAALMSAASTSTVSMSVPLTSAALTPVPLTSIPSKSAALMSAALFDFVVISTYTHDFHHFRNVLERLRRVDVVRMHLH